MRLLVVVCLLSTLLIYLGTPVVTKASSVNLQVSFSCTGTDVSAAFTWSGADTTAQGLWVDLNQLDSNFGDGTTSSGPFKTNITSFYWPGFPQATSYFARFNQQMSDGSWDPGPAIQFTTTTCNGAPATAAPAATNTPPSIRSLTCSSPTASATLSNVQPASVQTASMSVNSGDTVSCTADVGGDYASIVWHGPNGDGSGAAFSTVIGPPKGSVPYDISVQVNGSGNPVVAHISVGSVAGATTSGTGTPGSNCVVQAGIEVCAGIGTR